MPDNVEHFWDILSAAEGDSAVRMMEELQNQAWADRLLREINENGGISRGNKTRLFELRFGHALHRAGILPAYEVPGEAGSTLDFGFRSADQNWLVELMRLEETDAVRSATGSRVDQDGIVWSGRMLGTNADDPRQSEEGETLKAVQRICQKCERGGHPHKFFAPQDAYHVILVDFRTFLHGGDEHDRIHIGLGGEFIPEGMLRRYWEGTLISGVFSPRTGVRGAAQARERVHFLGFVNERTCAPGEFGGVTQFIANPHLFRDADEVNAAIATWPLQPARVLNGGQ